VRGPQTLCAGFSLATTTITVASFQNACAECADAIAAESWASAVSWYARAEAINAGLDLDASDAQARVRRRESLDGLNKAISAAEVAAAQGSDESRFVTTKTIYGTNG